MKLKFFETETKQFAQYIVKERIRDKRNKDVSHKEYPEKQYQNQDIDIPYGKLLRGVGLALKLMKQIDRKLLGPSAPFLWREARKRRYGFMSPPFVGYLLLPYLRLSPEDRIRVSLEEIRDGLGTWTQIPTIINGQPATVLAYKKWGVILLGDRRLEALDAYPLHDLKSIEVLDKSPAIA